MRYHADVPPTRRFLVTAGNTREMIDRVRDWGNIFTGNTGFSIARALSSMGHVDLLTSNTDHLKQAQSLPSFSPSRFHSHANLVHEIDRLMHQNVYDAILMTAAVADYKPAGAYQIVTKTPLPDGTESWIVRPANAGKIKSNHPAIAFVGTQTEKIIDLFRTRWNFTGLLFKFKLEVDVTKDELISIGEKSRLASNANYLIANSLDMITGPAAGAFLLSDKGTEFVPRDQLASRLAQQVHHDLAFQS